ncbi:DUF3592 domain-containing protein [Corynebacterium bovis]|uniref:DUF3592 domain-containing protein n=1 Tax=Corynebacterium bovis TaxID=36808 RepID=UPI0024475FEC|nr:DUF3592 domain-containing protein [Corynebacterium bovis]MDH2455721.1 DUF3592 domain-containing protein [Corynebacterium bovis]
MTAPAHPVRAARERSRARTRDRRLIQAVLALLLLAAVVCAGMVVSSAVDDVRIARDRGTATATVVDIDPLRTVVRFRDDRGEYHTPDAGLMYPTGLVRGQRVKVEYRRSDPDTVKVAGRSWTLAFLPAGSTFLVCLVVAALLLLVVRRTSRRAAGVG